MKSNTKNLHQFLDQKVAEYNQPSFIAADPICVPHCFSKKQDIEIAAFFTAIFAWGNRTTIIAKGKELMQLMHNAPHDFCLHHSDQDLKSLLHFKHRTFNTTDLLYFVDLFKNHYTKHKSLETAFAQWMQPTDANTENALNGFHHYFFNLPDAPNRTKKHVSMPMKNSTCKRLNMFLRWMVRKDKQGVDFGIWKKIKPAQLVMPLDLHVVNVAKRFQLIEKAVPNWQTAVELTEYLRKFDADDPVKYDFALFSLGVIEKYR